MGKLVTPQVYFIGYTTINTPELDRYLRDSDNLDFLASIKTARTGGLSDGEILTSFYAKLCYKSLTLGQNKNLSRVRDIHDNLRSVISTAHGSVFEHCTLNFVVRYCSRVFTHEACRHRVGTALSQTSGRYVRGDSIDIVFDPILEPVREQLTAMQEVIEKHYADMVEEMGLDEMKDFDRKKKITSALRRMLPNGQSNEIGISLNLRALRHIIQIRTSRHAEWEIREVFGQAYRLIKDKYPMVFCDAKEEIVHDLLEVSGMKMQPYEKE